MKKTAGTAKATRPATINVFSQPGRNFDVTPMEASEIPGTRGDQQEWPRRREQTLLPAPVQVLESIDPRYFYEGELQDN